MSNFITFQEKNNNGAKTKKINVLTSDGIILLGNIKWYPQWRRYAFYPYQNTLYDKTCLQQITDKLDELMEERKLT